MRNRHEGIIIKNTRSGTIGEFFFDVWVRLGLRRVLHVTISLPSGADMFSYTLTQRSYVCNGYFHLALSPSIFYGWYQTIKAPSIT